MKLEGYKTVTTKSGRKIYRRFFEEVTDAEEVSKNLDYETFITKHVTPKVEVVKKGRRHVHILDFRLSRAASVVQKYVRLWNKYGYLKSLTRKKTFPVKGKHGRVISRTIRSNPCYIANLKPFYEMVEDKFHIHFDDKEKKVIDLFFDLPSRRPLISDIIRSDMDFLEDIKNELIKFSVRGTNVGGIVETASSIYSGLGKARFLRMIDNIGKFVNRGDMIGFVRFVRKLEERNDREVFERRIYDIYLALYANMRMLNLVKKLVSLSFKPGERLSYLDSPMTGFVKIKSITVKNNKIEV